MSRVTTAYVSQYQRDRVHGSRLFRYEKRTFSANFNGALETGVGVTMVDWYCSNTSVAVIANATCSATACGVTVTANAIGVSYLKCSATMTDGSVMTQLFRIVSLPSPAFCEPPLSATA